MLHLFLEAYKCNCFHKIYSSNLLVDNIIATGVHIMKNKFFYLIFICWIFCFLNLLFECETFINIEVLFVGVNFMTMKLYDSCSLGKFF